MTDNLKGNLSTILVWVYVIVAPYLADYMTQDQFVTLMTAIIGICLAVYSSYNPNSFKFLGNDKECDCEIEEIVLNEEYEENPYDQE